METFCAATGGGVGAILNFNPPYLSFGTSIGMVAGSNQSILLQPGIYRIHLSAEDVQTSATNPFFTANPFIVLLLNGSPLAPPVGIFPAPQGRWLVSGGTTQFGSVAGDHLVQVSTPNTTLQFTIMVDSAGFPFGCRLAITQEH